ncbi:hypothetical protein KSS87_022557 [Heliosperma pusillum]|nr:hypothetical protein KSS87_022557 [Heliosperma pusillum]
MAETVFTPALEGIKVVKSENGEILAKPFLDACKHILPVIVLNKKILRSFKGLLSSLYFLTLAEIYKLGASMALVKSDIGGNITRLETKYNTDPAKFNYLYSMVQVEVETKTAKGSSSCTNGLLWLTRAMDFLVELFRNLLEHADWTMSQACTDSYSKTLKKWHGWLASSSFTVAMKLAPDRKKFMEVLGGDSVIEEEEEKEMQIGFPTDVKHVAHIGWDGSAANAPSWIQGFKDGESNESPQNGVQKNVTGERGLRFIAQENRCIIGSDASTPESPSRRRSDKVKGAKRHGLAGSSTDSPRRSSASASENKTNDASSSSKTSRRRKTKTSSKSKPKPTSTRPSLAYSDPGIESTA